MRRVEAGLEVENRKIATQKVETRRFNGKDLTGWLPCHIAPDSFTVRVGLLVTSGRPIGTSTRGCGK